MEWYKCFLQRYKSRVIQAWLYDNQRDIPNQYNLSDLSENKVAYFELLTDIHTPIEEHPSFNTFQQMWKSYAETRTPIQYLLHSARIWRKLLLEYMWTYCDEMQVSVNEMKAVIPVMHNRLDNIQQYICVVYWEHDNSLLEQKDEKISQLHKDRLTILGKMAASMAHEIRNPLTAIEGFIHLIRSEMNTSPLNQGKINGFLDIVQSEFKGLYGQITGFLGFSKNVGADEPLKMCSIREIIDSVLELVSPRLIDENIEIKLSLNCDNVLAVQKVSVQQVLSNLIINSIDALSSIKYSRLIEIHTYEDGKNCYIDVIDNGIGIPLSIQNTIFTPFVTSKSYGTGLGLAISNEIMKKNMGNISFASQKGETKFTLSFKKTPRSGTDTI